MARKRCTCKNQTLYYGSYYCDPKAGWCRKDKDKTWWARLLKREAKTK
jgi:hypothetical protein